MAEFVSFTGLIPLNIGGAEHYDSDRILTTPGPKLLEERGRDMLEAIISVCSEP